MDNEKEFKIIGVSLPARDQKNAYILTTPIPINSGGILRYAVTNAIVIYQTIRKNNQYVNLLKKYRPELLSALPAYATLMSLV